MLYWKDIRSPSLSGFALILWTGIELTLKAGVRLGVCPFLLFTRDIFCIERFGFGGE